MSARHPALLAASALALALLGPAAVPAARAQPAPAASYARGYADAILAEVFELRDYRLDVQDGTLVVDLADRGGLEADKIARALLEIDGIHRVMLREEGEVLTDLAREGEAAAEDTGEDDWDLFPSRELFLPLLADPRWPRFSAAYQWYSDDSELDHVTAVSFGESFAFLRSPATGVGDFELGMQAAVFSVFDLASNSFDLVNSDFVVGGTLAHHLGDVTTMLRLYHQSSHLGDEYLLRNDVDRENLSYEVVDLLVSYSPSPAGWLRLYGGGGLIVHREPELERGLTQVGVELRSPVAFKGGHLRPLGGVDLQFREESDWNADVSTRFGVQIEHARLRRLRIQILGEYYRGRSPVGQFYGRRIQTAGLGLHIGF